MIDTNVLLDWLLDRNPAHTKAIDKLLKNKKEVHVPDMAIAELVFALEGFYKLPREIVVQNLAKVLSEPALSCNRALFQRAAADYADYPALSLVDCCLMAYAELQSILPLWTYDKKLIANSGGRAKTPA